MRFQTAQDVIDFLDRPSTNQTIIGHIEPKDPFTKKTQTNQAVLKIKNKFIQIAENVQEERLNICKGCEFYKNESDGPICTQCNCLLNKKVSLVEESCPLKKWVEIKTQSSGGCGCNKK